MDCRAAARKSFFRSGERSNERRCDGRVWRLRHRRNAPSLPARTPATARMRAAACSRMAGHRRIRGACRSPPRVGLRPPAARLSGARSPLQRQRLRRPDYRRHQDRRNERDRKAERDRQTCDDLELAQAIFTFRPAAIRMQHGAHTISGAPQPTDKSASSIIA